MFTPEGRTCFLVAALDTNFSLASLKLNILGDWEIVYNYQLLMIIRGPIIDQEQSGGFPTK